MEETKTTKGPNFIVFCDTETKEIDPIYAERVVVAFQQQTGWKVKEGTRIYDDLREFSKGYCKINRDPVEVVGIFRIAHGLLEI